MFNRGRISLREGEKVLELDGGDGCTAMSMYVILLKRTFRIVWYVYLTTIRNREEGWNVEGGDNRRQNHFKVVPWGTGFKRRMGTDKDTAG